MKKIFIVFMVILLLGLTVVPSFAVDDDNYCYFVLNVGGSLSVNGSTYTRYSGVVKLPSTSLILTTNSSGYGYSIYINGVYYDRFGLDSSISFSVNTGDFVSLLYYSDRNISFAKISGTRVTRYYNLDVWVRTPSDCTVAYYPMSYFRVHQFSVGTGYYNLNGSLVYSDGLNNFYNQSVSDYTFSEPYTLYTPYTSFVGNLWHSFEWLGDVTTSYSGFFIFIVGILAVLFVVFLFVFFFKRFGGV